MISLLLASHDWPGHAGAWFPLFPLLFFGLWVAVFVIVGRRWRHPHHHSGESVLAERYARGEIDEAEFRQRQAVLKADR
ncbi:MAG: SHOCT domain-containing protein [Actinomycetota bacterium]|jgi:putative membrane protein|nr:SHOCT domain-containing protein [Actinomycetota bacterium]